MNVRLKPTTQHHRAIFWSLCAVWLASAATSDGRASDPAGETVSAATARYRDYWGGAASQDVHNEFYTTFKYSHLKGLEPEKGVSRRDPSTIIKVDGLYYVYYTKYSGPEPVTPKHAELVSDTVPMWDWDLASVWYATSKDGFEWKEQGEAVPRGPKGTYDDRSVFTPEIMNVDGRYYLYYQCTSGKYTRRQFESIALATADSPKGPWKKSARPILEPTRDGEWDGTVDDRTKVKAPASFDSKCVHDPCLIVRNGKYWLYYKGEPMGWHGPMDRTGVMWGVAIADRPEGPYVRSPLNPITNSGHEVAVWPYRGGVAALCAWDGPEKNTIQFAPDGLNFSVKAQVDLPPIAPGFYRPDAYTNTTDGQGVTWGLCQVIREVNPPGIYSYLIRFDCDLHQGAINPEMKARPHPDEGSYFQKGNRRAEKDTPLFPTEPARKLKN